MHVSPPITVLAVLAVMVAGAVWLAPPQREVAQVSAMLPTSTYQKLALWGGRTTLARTDDRQR